MIFMFLIVIYENYICINLIKLFMQTYHNSFYAMGTRFNAVFAFEDECICENAFQLINSEALRIERRLNYFDPASDLSKINKSDINKSIPIDDELHAILKTCLEYSELTNGAYDITARSLIESLPGNNYECKYPAEKIILDPDNKTVRLLTDSIKIDLGGFGKGYALENIKAILASSPIENGIISFGGSSIYARGNHPGGNAWMIGINDLFNTEKPVVEIALSDTSISVSGNFFVDDKGLLINKKHIVNPRNLNVSEEVKIVLVSSDSPLQAEILSTAFMNMNDEEIELLQKQLENVTVTIIEYDKLEPIIKKF